MRRGSRPPCRSRSVVQEGRGRSSSSQARRPHRPTNGSPPQGPEGGGNPPGGRRQDLAQRLSVHGKLPLEPPLSRFHLAQTILEHVHLGLALGAQGSCPC